VSWILSLDALVGFEASRTPGQIRWLRAGLLSGMFVAVVLLLVSAYSDRVGEAGRSTACLGSLCTKVSSLHQSAATTLTVFIGKLLLQVVFRPGQPLILQSRLHICLRQQEVTAEAEATPEHRELLVQPSRAPLNEPLLLKQEEES
jgi:hypothetical protein